MNTILVSTTALKNSFDICGKSFDLALSNEKNTKVPLDSDVELLEFIYEHVSLSSVNYNKLSSFLYPSSSLIDKKFSSPVDFFKQAYFVSNSLEPVFELKINNKWYPIMASISKSKVSFSTEFYVQIHLFGQIGAYQFVKYAYLLEKDFLDVQEKPVKKDINELLKKAGVRLTTQDAIEKAKTSTIKLISYLNVGNQAFDVGGVGLSYSDYWGWSEAVIGTVDSPSMVVVEPNLENRHAHYDLPSETWKLPFVRVFSFKHKTYVYVDVDDMTTHVYHRDGKDRIVLPTEMLGALNGVFNAQQDKIFGDLFHGRHGGIVVLANGPSGVGKCLGKGTLVLLADGTVRPVESIKVGDQLMGPDGNIKNVLSTNVGTGPLFRIDPIKGNSWVCNDVHVLTLRNCSTGKVVDISLDEYLKSSTTFKNTHKLFTVGINNFLKKPVELPIDPYFMGVWFGDGTKFLRKSGGKKYLNSISIANVDNEIISYINSIAKKWNMRVREQLDEDKCPQYHLVNTDSSNKNNVMLNVLRELVGQEVVIPHMYLTSSRQERLQFLAGYLDADGELSNNCFVISQKRDDWAQAIVFLAKSLGFCATSTKRKSGYMKADGSYFEDDYNVITISGHTDEIPTKIGYKQASERMRVKNPNHTGFTALPIGEGEYYGFTLDGDGRFLLGDFTVTHNTLTAEVFAEFQERPLYSMEMSEIGTTLKEVEVNLQKIFTRAKKWNAVLLFDEADIFLAERASSDLERSAIVGIFLRLLDYYEGTFFLTTNRGDNIDKAFKSRVTLYLDYPELSAETREKIWQSMLKSAEFVVTEGNILWSQIYNTPLNGRQIRNQVRLLKLMYSDGKLTTDNIKASLKFAAL